jgi:hypothetical protein
LLAAQDLVAAMKEYRFNAEMQSEPDGGAYVFFPFDVQKEFGLRLMARRIPVPW